jgi:MSHA biogenesis protein MshM
VSTNAPAARPTALYLQHFRLQESPFRLSPDTAYFYPGSSHQQALNVLLVALADGEGFLKISGEVGLGKTLLCRTLLRNLGAAYATAWIPNPDQSPASIRASLARELGLELASTVGQEAALRAITARLIELTAQGRRPVLLVDEAQALPTPALEAVRLLTNIETEKRKLLQVVLFGQPELDRRLAQPNLRQLNQRITFSHRLEPLDSTHVGAYVAHRLCIAGHADGQLFDASALRALASHSGGVPRLINILAHKALLVAWGKGLAAVGRAEVERAAVDTESVAPPVAGFWRRWLGRGTALAGPLFAARKLHRTGP